MTPAVPDPTVEALSEAEWETRMARISPDAAVIAEDVWTDDEPTLAEYELTERILAARAAAPDALRVAVEALADGYAGTASDAREAARKSKGDEAEHWESMAENFDYFEADLRDLLDDPALAGRATGGEG